MIEWTKEEIEAGLVSALLIRTDSDKLSYVSIELACQRNALLSALTELLRVDDSRCGSQNSEESQARSKARKAIARTKGKQ